MALQASVIISRAQNTLLDLTGDFWSSNELIDYLNAAFSSVLIVKPDAIVKTSSFLLVQSATQTLPNDGVQFFSLTRNLTPSQRVITEIDINHLNHADPDWPMTNDSTVQNFMHDKRNPKIFYVYPVPVNSNQTVEIIYTADATRVSVLTDPIPFDDVYESVLHFMTVAQALLKNSKRGDMTKGSQYFNMALNLLGQKTSAQTALAPETPEKAR